MKIDKIFLKQSNICQKSFKSHQDPEILASKSLKYCENKFKVRKDCLVGKSLKTWVQILSTHIKAKRGHARL